MRPVEPAQRGRGLARLNKAVRFGERGRVLLVLYTDKHGNHNHPSPLLACRVRADAWFLHKLFALH